MTLGTLSGSHLVSVDPNRVTWRGSTFYDKPLSMYLAANMLSNVLDGTEDSIRYMYKPALSPQQAINSNE